MDQTIIQHLIRKFHNFNNDFGTMSFTWIDDVYKYIEWPIFLWATLY